MRPQAERLISAALFMLLAGGVPVRAQSDGGSIAGTVTDRSGAMLPDARVEVAGDGPALTFTTRADGHYRFLNLPPGAYRLIVSRRGFQPLTRSGLLVGVGERLSLALILEIEGVEQSIEVKAGRSQGGWRVSFTQNELTRIPAPLGATSLLPSMAGVVTDRINVGGNESHQQPHFVFRGSRMLDTAWTIDGVVVTDRQIGSLPGYFDLNAFEEILFTSASSDITRPGSGLGVNMVVQSGTNQVRGSLRGYFTNARLQASNVRDDLRGVPFFITAHTADHTQQISEYGADLGGPLVPGRVWYWASAARQDVRVFRQSSGDERTVLTPRTVKVNWQATARDSINALWLDHGLERFGVNPAALRAPVTARQDVSPLYPQNPFHGLWKVEGQRIARPTVSLTARYAYYSAGVQNISVGTGPAGFSSRLGETVGATSSSSSLRPQHSLSLDGNHFRTFWGASHRIKFGTLWQRVDMFNRTMWPGDGVVAFDNSATDRRARIYREQLGKNRLLSAGAYLSDTFSAGRMTMNLGLRYDRQRGQALASSPSGNPAFPDLVPGIEFEGETDSPAWMDLSPRAAVTYALDADHRTVLRGSLGRYASQIVMGVAAQRNPANAIAWIEYPWVDLNGDRLAQPNEVRTDLSYLTSEGFNPSDPATPVPPSILDPNVKSRMTTGTSVAIEHEFTSSLAVTVGYHFARHTRWPYTRWRGLTADDYAVAGTLSATLPDGTPVSIPVYAPDPLKVRENGSVRIISSDDSYSSTYHGVEATLVRRWSDGWMMRAMGAWNNSRSFYGQTPPANSLSNPTRLDGATGGGPLSAPRDPLVHGGQVAPATLALGGGGTVFLNARWQVSLNGAYLLPWGLEVAGNLLGRQGTPSPYVIPQRLGLDGVRSVLVSPKVDSVRLDDVWNLDLRLAKQVRLRRLRLEATCDVFNALNGNAALLRERNLRSPNFDRVNMNVSPRILRLGVRLTF